MKYFPLVFLFLSSPAYALTWKEFWEPFNSNYQYRYYFPNPTRSYEVCKKEIYREKYIPGDMFSPGYVKTWRETIIVPCN